jgi:hypothetical protein
MSFYVLLADPFTKGTPKHCQKSNIKHRNDAQELSGITEPFHKVCGYDQNTKLPQAIVGHI